MTRSMIVVVIAIVALYAIAAGTQEHSPGVDAGVNGNLSWCYADPTASIEEIRHASMANGICAREIASWPFIAVMPRRKVVEVAICVAKRGGKDDAIYGITRGDAAVRIVRMCQCHNASVYNPLISQETDVWDWLNYRPLPDWCSSIPTFIW